MRRLSSVILKINSDLRRMGVSDRLQLWGSSRRTSERRRSGECHSRRRDQCLLRQAKKAVEPSPRIVWKDYHKNQHQCEGGWNAAFIYTHTRNWRVAQDLLLPHTWPFVYQELLLLSGSERSYSELAGMFSLSLFSLERSRCFVVYRRVWLRLTASCSSNRLCLYRFFSMTTRAISEREKWRREACRTKS